MWASKPLSTRSSQRNRSSFTSSLTFGTPSDKKSLLSLKTCSPSSSLYTGRLHSKIMLLSTKRVDGWRVRSGQKEAPGGGFGGWGDPPWCPIWGGRVGGWGRRSWKIFEEFKGVGLIFENMEKSDSVRERGEKDKRGEESVEFGIKKI